MSIITGFDNTDSALNIPKFYLGKVTGQENIGARDSEGNPVPYYSSGDIGTLQSSVILQEFNKDEFKAPETAPNTDWINFLNPANPSDTTKTKQYSSFGFTKDVTWTIGLNDRDTEINYVTAVLSHWDDFIVNFGGIDYYFKDVYFVPVRQDLYIASDNFQTILKTPDDLFNALNNIKDSTSYLTIAVSNDARFFNEIVVDGEHNLYNFSNQLVAKNYLAAQDLYNNKSFFSFDAIYNVLESIRSKADLVIGDKALRDLSLLNSFQANTSYDNLTSGIIGNYELITGLNLTGIQGFPTGYVSGQYLQANETGLEFVPIDDPVFDFTGLTDTPSNITSVKFVRGNQAGDGLEFTGVKFLEDVDDRPSTPITSGYLQLTDQNTLAWNPVAPGGGDVTYNFTGSEYFTGLKDTPSGYESNKFLRSTHVGIEYADINNGLVSFTGLSDTPSSFAADKFLKINNAANAVEYVDIPSPSVDFTGLNDTPTSYVNSSGKYLRINNTEDGVEFIDISGEISSQEISWNSYLRRGDLPNASNHPGMFAYVSIDELGGNSGSAYIAHGNDWVQIFPTVPNFSFSGLVDTPTSYAGASGKFMKVSDDESGIEYANLPDPIVDFTGLTDTPSSFVGHSGKYLQVNAAENSLEFVNPLFGTGSFVGFGGATVLIGLETAQPQQGWNDRQITQLQGHSGIKNLSLSNNEITLPAGKYLINAEGGVFRSKQTRIGIEFTAGDYVGQRFESRSNYAGSIVGNDQGGARGSVKTAVQSQNQMTFKVVSYVGESQSATTFEYAQTDVTVLDLGGDRDILSITGLFDTPTSYVGGSGKFLQVNNSEDAVQYSSLSGQISSQEIDWLAYSTISDLPSASEHHGMFAHVHSEGAAYMAHAGNWEKIYPVNGSSLTFTGLSDTPNVYDDGKILQSTADGLEWVDMPAGGGGGGGSSDVGAAENNSYIKSFIETFTEKVPDAIIVENDNPRVYDLKAVITTQDPHIIQYHNGQQNSDGSSKIFSFIDDVSGSLQNTLTNTNHILHPDDSNLQDIINNGRALYFGGGGSLSGGSLSGGSASSLRVIQDKSNFYTDLPDAIVWPHSPISTEAADRSEAILHLKFVHEPHSTNGVDNDIFYECRDINQGGVFLGFAFNNNSNGDYSQLYSSHTNFQDVPSATNSLKWFIENNRAIYYGGGGGGGEAIIQKGTYTGNSVANNGEQTIDLGFTPVRVEIFGRNDHKAHAIMLKDKPDTFYSWRAIDGSHDTFRTFDTSSIIVQNGFKVANGSNANDTHLNFNGVEFDYYVTTEGSVGGGVGGDSSNYEFCRAQVSSSSSIAHPEADVDLDINQLATDSKNWIHTDTTQNTVGILVPEDGLYDVSFNIRPVTAGNNLWRDNVSFLHTVLQLIKADGTNVLIQETREAKDTGNGTTLNNHLYLDNLSLDQGDFLYLRCRVYSNNTSLSWAIDDNFSFLSVSKSAGGGGGGSVGGIGSDADVIAKSNFSEIIPDKINVPILRGTNLSKIQTRFFTFEGFFGRSTPSELIQYEMNIGGSERYSINFENNANGTWDSYVEVDNSSTSIDFSKIPSAITNKPTLKEFIDANRAIYLGGGSAGGGGSSTFAGLTDTPSTLTEGSGQYLKVSDDGQTIEYVDLPAGGGSGGIGKNLQIIETSNFAGTLPDMIVVKNGLGSPVVGRFYEFSGPQSTDLIKYTFHEYDGHSRMAYFKNDSTGSNAIFNGQFTSENASYYNNATSLQEVIDNGHAIYFGGDGSSSGGSSPISAVNQIQDNIDNIPLIGSGVQIPDAILIKDINATTTNGNDHLIQLDFAAWVTSYNSNGDVTSQQFSYETNNLISKRWYIRFDSVDGSHLSISADQHVRKEFDSIQEYISSGRALYFGAGGGSSTFAGLTDTPSALTEGSGQYLKVSDDGQTIEYVDLPAGGGDGSSPSTGSSLNNNDYIKDFSNFSGELPDSIIIRGAASTLDQVLAGRFYYINGTSSTDQIFYDFLNWRVGFNNDASGTNGSFYNRDSNTLLAGNSTWEFFDGASSLQDIIDNGDAIYYGGSSSSSDGADSVDDITDLPDNPVDGQLVTVGCDLYIGCNGEWVKVGADTVAPPSEAPACVSNLEEYNQYTEYKDQFLADNASTSFSAGLNNQTNIHDFVHDVCLFADSNLNQERNTVVIDETTFKWGMFAGDQNINIRAQAFSGPNIGSCTFKEWRSDLPNFPKTNAQETVFIDRDASITGYFECTLAPDQPNCNQVALHLQPAAGETIADKSDNQHAVTTVGDTVVDNTATLFGGGTMNFDGNGDALSVGDNTTFKWINNYSSPFTIECWVFVDAITTDWLGRRFIPLLSTSAATSSSHGFKLGVNAQGFIFIIYNGSGQNVGVGHIVNDADILNKWVHLAATWDGKTMCLYVDGSQKDTSTPAAVPVNNENSNNMLKIGHQTHSAPANTIPHFDGKMQDIRISKKAVYTGNFTPPANLLANPCGFPGDQPTCSEVDFHLQASSGGTVEDKSDNNRTITNPNNVSNQSFIDNSETLFGESTLFFSTSRLLHFYPANFGSNDFTVEFWIKYDSPITTSTKDIIVTKGRDPTSTIELSITLNQDKLRLLNNLVLESTNTGMASVLNNWTHIAAVRSGNSIYLYVNGQREIDVAINGSVYASPYELEIGNKSSSGGWTNNLKHMQDFRISKKAVYTSNFVPAAALLDNPC